MAKRAAGRQAGGSERELDVLDYAYPDVKIVLEFEGWAEHGQVFETFHGDRPRNRRLQLAGWLLLQFTAESTEEEIVRDVTAALAARAA